MAYLYIGNKKVSPVIPRNYKNVNVSGTTVNITLRENVIFTANILTTLTITNPINISAGFISQINFNSGSTPTTIISSQINWFGENVIDNIFTPIANKEYLLVIYYTGINYIGIVQYRSL